jgi:protease-4
MKKNPWLILLALVFVFGSLFVFLMGSAAVSLFGESNVKVTAKNSILHLKLEGVIMDGKKILKPLEKYSENKNIKAIVVEINSPGGVVGPSQEIYMELKRVREQQKKPVVAVSTGLMASGAYYAAVGADKIVVAPGALVGSIGVIMEFMNLEKLYDWAKVSRYSITTGKYKDSGAEYRPMREDERSLFQSLINDVWVQFKEAVASGRNLKLDIVNQYADGRVFTGRQAVEKGLADQIGTVQDAFQLAADMANISNDFDIFEAPKAHRNFLDMFMSNDDDEASSKIGGQIDKTIKTFLHAELANRPLFLMPGNWY